MSRPKQDDKKRLMTATVFRGKAASWLWGLVLLVAITAAYQQVWHAGFVWDDDQHLTQNPCVIGPWGFKEIWTTPAARICPLVISTFRLEYQLWGLNPLPYHLVNVALHAASAILLWRLLRRLNVAGAWLGAALWALHPVQVESVAWITELKNAESCFFYLLATLTFVRWRTFQTETVPAERDYALSLLFGLLAMASKSSTVVLPAVLGLCLWWIDGRWQWRNLRRLAPFLVMAAVTSSWTLRSQDLEGGNSAQFLLGFPQRIAVAGKVVWFYLGKLLWPSPITFIYPKWELNISDPALFLPTLGLAAVFIFLWLKRSGKFRCAFFAFAYFVVALSPMLGLVPNYFLRYSFVGDHFQYLASMAPLALIGAGATLAARSWPRELKATASAATLLLLGFLTWQQCKMYKDIPTLWETTIQRNPGAWIAYNNLGNYLLQKHRVDESIPQFYKALEVRPELAVAHFNLGNAYFAKGELDRAISHFRDGLALEATAPLHTNLGHALFAKGETTEALSHYEEALRIRPAYAEAHYHLGVALKNRGQYEASMGHYRAALRTRPRYIEVANNLAWILATCPEPSLRNGTEAVALAENANHLTGGQSVAILDTLAAAYAEAGRFSQAIATTQQALWMARADSNSELTTDLLRKLARYRTNSAFHESDGIRLP